MLSLHEVRSLLLADDDPIVERILDEPDANIVLSNEFTMMPIEWWGISLR